MEQFFNKSDFPKVKEELNRLFRKNTFNMQKKRFLVDEYSKQYPQLNKIQNIKREFPDKLVNKEQSLKVPKYFFFFLNKIFKIICEILNKQRQIRY
ncbi:hypothetical protein IMG5_009180 [Ichthyophthirius multifiliis]|uniref:Uncharacterized protein n=1 Tax=Ichthyophthirius multifiliis TaxID=5932 RepID=G0QJU4_ICHMU|nr:hypothetical protein IMG5_009180 [Ichthyophthirius multifiliis]EGR34509.1 hypothetical protein IMG5_009180 [Ichthyophthirius multifiliis]|eukprot:XP_004039813.1 hypothetical protein IMG5_009180 [Ichthyophthirius multifiliis]